MVRPGGVLAQGSPGNTGPLFSSPRSNKRKRARVLLVGLVFALAALRAAIVLSVGALGRGVFQTRLT